MTDYFKSIKHFLIDAKNVAQALMVVIPVCGSIMGAVWWVGSRLLDERYVTADEGKSIHADVKAIADGQTKLQVGVGRILGQNEVIMNILTSGYGGHSTNADRTFSDQMTASTLTANQTTNVHQQ